MLKVKLSRDQFVTGITAAVFTIKAYAGEIEHFSGTLRERRFSLFLQGVIETILRLLQATQLFAAVDETADDANETLQEFIETLQNAAASSGLVSSLVHNLTQAVSRVSDDNDERYFCS